MKYSFVPALALQFVFLHPVPSVIGQDAAPAIRLAGPEVARLAWDTRGMTAADFDQDGKRDIALINNENGKLVMLYQRVPGSPSLAAERRAVTRDRWEPELEDSRFQKVSLPADQRHFALTNGDFDSDGRPDLALTGGMDALTIRFQGESGGFSKSWTYRNFEPLQGTRTLVSSDLNQDGKTDLAVLAKQKLLIFLQQAGGGFGEPVVYHTTEEKAGYLMAEDTDGDQKPDLLYLAGSGEGSLRIRKQTSPGAFASELSLDYTVPAHGIGVSRSPAGPLVLTRVNARSRLIERHTLQMDAPGAIQQDKLLPTLHAPAGGVKNALHAIGDFNGDGLMDVAQADGKVAAVSLYFQQPDGTFQEPKTFPSLAGINGLAAVKPTAGGPALVVVTSAREGVGISRLSAEGRLEFPSMQTVEGTPSGVVAVRLPGEIIVPVVLAEKDRSWSLHQLLPGSGSSWTGNAQPIKGLKKEPTGLIPGDLDGDSRDDLLVLVGKEPALVVLAKADAFGLQDPVKETAGIKSQLTDLTPERVAILDLDADGRGEILIAATGYARTLRLNPDRSDVIIVDQCNARSAEDKLSVPVLTDINGDGKPDLLFQETGNRFWQILARDSSGVWRSTSRVEADSAESVSAVSLSLGREPRPCLMAFGRDRFWTAPLAGSRPALTLSASYETDLKGCEYFMAIPADLNADGIEEITAFDGESQLMEVLQPGGVTGQDWKSLMHYILFEENIHFRGRKGEENVREVLTGDFTGDGKTDLVLLLHDRVLLYPQS